MSDKSQYGDDACFALSDHRVVMLQGRDAVGFAQAQFMNDVGVLAAAQWQWNGWLTPKGRVIALFALLKLDDETLWLLVPDADPQSLVERLRGFLFRSKVAISVRDELQVSGRFTPPETASGNIADVTVDGAVEFDMGASGGSRTLRVAAAASATGSDTSAANAANTDGPAKWRMVDLEHGLPRLPPSQAEQWTPQQLSLERLHGFSVKKGCYPGQEIVARTHFLGKAKRGLALMQGDEPLMTAAEVRADDVAIGRVIASGDGDGRHLALAVLPLGREDQTFQIDGQTAHVMVLKGGLAR